MPFVREIPYHVRLGVHFDKKWRQGKKDKYGRRKYRVYWFFKGRQYFIYVDQAGAPLVDKPKTLAIANKIALEVDENRHDPLKWLPEKRSKYAVVNGIAAYLSARQKDEITRKQFRDITYYLGIFARFAGENVINDLRDVKGMELARFMAEISGGWKRKTVTSCMTILDAFLRWSTEKMELLDKKPNVPKPVKTQDGVIRYLTLQQQLMIIEFIPSGFKPIIRFMMKFGVRTSEALAVQLEDIDLGNHVVTIRHTISDGALVRRTKTGKIRFLPITNDIRPVIRSAMENRIGTGYLFVNPRTGTKISMTRLLVAWRRACEKAGLVGYKLSEGTRKSVATRAFNAGLDAGVVSDALGNSPGVLKKHYAQVTAERYAEVFRGKADVARLKSKR